MAIESKSDNTSADVPPKSATVLWINTVALFGLFCGILFLRDLQTSDSATIIWTIIASVAVPVIVLEYLVLGPRYGPKIPANAQNRVARCLIKYIGLLASFGAMIFAHWLFPYYSNGYALVVYEVLALVAIPLLILAPVYIWFIDSRMEEPEDEFYMAGLAAIGRWKEIDRELLGKHFRAWVIKIFFFPYIIHVTLPLAKLAIQVDVLERISSSPFGFMDIYIDTIWLIDVAFSCTGYFLTLRLFDSHVRSADPNMLGWVVCMICYGPFYVMLANNFLQYEDNFYWGQWLADYPVIKAMWAIPIIVLLANYSFATVQFGIRFSNLTHRGIITSGPFRLTKHPQYISKNIAWWLISVPFIHEAGFADAARLCLMLVGINIIFYYRAKTEEKHLSFDPDYRAYCEWIAEHGLFARMKSLVFKPS